MGYTTEFEGHFEMDPPLSPEKVARLNEYCEKRHGGAFAPDPGCPSLWCNWEFSQDGTKMYWNGSEKSYKMDRWAEKLRREHFPTATVTGEVRAFGEERSDVWKMVVKDGNIVFKSVGFDSRD